MRSDQSRRMCALNAFLCKHVVAGMRAIERELTYSEIRVLFLAELLMERKPQNPDCTHI